MRPVESALNLIWAVASSLLLACWLAWLVYARPTRRQAILSGIALLALVVVLLPAISMTDDRLAMQSPAEFEHALRRDDGNFEYSFTVPTLVGLASFLLVTPLRPVDSHLLALGRLCAPPQLTGNFTPAAVRPPPAVVASLA